jgi:hypothetical protein
VVEVLAGAVDRSAGTGSRTDLVEVIGCCQGLINMLTAVQDVAIMNVAAIEEEWAEDGLVVESRRAPGHVALDAPDVVAGALCVSHLQAQKRVVLAARLAAAVLGAEAEGTDGEGEGADGGRAEGDTSAEADGAAAADADAADADADDAGAVPSGLSGVHEAMRDGRLDGYAASVLGEELQAAPPQVARAVVSAIDEFFGLECASLLRRRCRRALARVSPDLLRQRAQKAREEAGLRRWAEAPGVDRWSGTFPSEQAAMGWAAVDALARRYVKEGVCERLEQARGKALIDLVTGNASIEVTVVITTSEDADPDAPGDADGGPGRSPQPAAGPAESGTPADAGPDDPSACDAGPHDQDDRGTRHTEDDVHAQADPADTPEADAEDKGSCESDPPAGFGGRAAPGPAPAAPAAPVASLDEDLVEAYGPFAGDPMLLRRAWLVALLRGAAGVRVRFARCHRRTGALLGDTDTGSAVSTSYRPSEKLKALVRTRDGRCRFPGCSVAARFCDLDHARPWPTGPTTAANLMCLCRRHHRIKPRPGWSVRLAVDGTATWTDPVGRERVTWPRNHLDLLVLPADPAGPADPARAAVARHETPSGTSTSKGAANTGHAATSASKGAANTGHAATSTPARPETDAEGASTLETVLEVLGDGYHPWTHPHRAPARRPWRGDLIRPRTGRPRLKYHRDRDHDHDRDHPHHHTHDQPHDGTPAGTARTDVEPPPF